MHWSVRARVLTCRTVIVQKKSMLNITRVTAVKRIIITTQKINKMSHELKNVKLVFKISVLAKERILMP